MKQKTQIFLLDHFLHVCTLRTRTRMHKTAPAQHYRSENNNLELEPYQRTDPSPSSSAVDPAAITVVKSVYWTHIHTHAYTHTASLRVWLASSQPLVTPHPTPPHRPYLEPRVTWQANYKAAFSKIGLYVFLRTHHPGPSGLGTQLHLGSEPLRLGMVLLFSFLSSCSRISVSTDRRGVRGGRRRGEGRRSWRRQSNQEITLSSEIYKDFLLIRIN